MPIQLFIWEILFGTFLIEIYSLGDLSFVQLSFAQFSFVQMSFKRLSFVQIVICPIVILDIFIKEIDILHIFIRSIVTLASFHSINRVIWTLVICPIFTAPHFFPISVMCSVITCCYAFMLPVATAPNAIIYQGPIFKTFFIINNPLT
jgi:hypothetical protein